MKRLSDSVSSSKALQEFKIIFAGWAPQDFKEDNLFNRCNGLTGKGLFTLYNSLKNHGYLKKVDITLGA